ncbi:MAG: fasciclin domain-containing protein [Cyanobacteria bacterium J06598_1]
MTEEEAVAEEPALEEDAVIEADAEMTEEDAVAEEPALEEDAVIEADAEMTEEEAVEAAEIEALDEAPVADEAVETEAPVAEEDINTEDFTIAELANNNDSFEVLSAALAAAELTEILGSEGPFTVFAPTDEAFAELPEGAVEQLLLPENKDVLVQVLTYHVVPTEMLAADLATGGVSTVEGSEIAVAVGDTITVDNANVVFADLEASNGVIHVIDRVILPAAPEGDVEPEAAE